MSALQEKRATIEDVARVAGVSMKTVSRVINKEPGVRPITQNKVLKAIDELDYRPSLSARGMGGSRSYVFALIYDNPSANYVVDVQKGVLSECRREGFEVIIHPCDHQDKNMIADVEELLWNSRADGLILTPPLSENTELISRLDNLGSRFVRITPTLLDHVSPCVVSDEYFAARRITEHLIDLGHRRIGFIKGHPDHRSSEERFRGFNDAMAEARINTPRNLCKQGFYTFESGLSAARKLLGMTIPPTAIFASNDDMAMGVIRGAYERGLRIPADLSVTGFDDAPSATQSWPALTTVKQPIKEIPQKAAAALIALTRGFETQKATQVVEVKAEIKIRQSTGPVRVS